MRIEDELMLKPIDAITGFDVIAACNEITTLRAQLAAAQAVQEILEQRLYGAIHAIKELKECIPPKDFKAYAQTVLDTYAMRGKEGE